MKNEKLVFKTRIDKTFFSMHFGMLGIILFFLTYTHYSVKDTSIFNGLLAWFVVAILFTVSSFVFLKIIIQDHFLMVNIGFNIYKIDIKTINKIESEKSMWVGFHKHGTAAKGLIISSKYRNDFYITPKDQNVFLQKIIQINPDIILKKD